MDNAQVEVGFRNSHPVEVDVEPRREDNVPYFRTGVGPEQVYNVYAPNGHQYQVLLRAEHLTKKAHPKQLVFYTVFQDEEDRVPGQPLKFSKIMLERTLNYAGKAVLVSAWFSEGE